MVAIIISIFGSLILGIYAHFSFQRHFVRSFNLSLNWTFAFDAFLIFSAFFRFIYRFQNDFTRNLIVATSIKASFVLMGFTGLILLILVSIDFFSLLRKIIPKTQGPSSDPGRRLFMKQVFTVGGLASAGMGTVSSYATSYSPELKAVEVPLPIQHKALNGLRIVQLSDVHIGPNLGKEFTQQLVDRIRPLDPDLIVVTGDMIDGSPAYLKDDLAPFKELQAKLGIFFVTGNHEYYWGGHLWNDEVKTLGMIPLVNEHRVLRYNGTPFALAGVTDTSTSRYDQQHVHSPRKARKEIPDDLYKILLAHQPKTCYEAAPLGFHLQLSGHTHAGQGYPWRLVVQLVHEYYEGLYDHKGMWVYVNSGTGFWGPPNRLGVSGEITLLTLKYT